MPIPASISPRTTRSTPKSGRSKACSAATPTSSKAERTIEVVIRTTDRANPAVDAGRRRLLADLAAYRPFDAREGEMVDRVRAFVAEHPQCFERSLTLGHVTGSAWIVDHSGTTTLLTHHRKLDRWLQCGGHADGESNILGVALREALEESGLSEIAIASRAIYDVDVHAIPERGSEPAHEHFDIRYAFFADPRQTPIVSRESYAVAWIALRHLEHYAIDDSVRRLAAKTSDFVARLQSEGNAR